jgi:hypothetical protein
VLDRDVRALDREVAVEVRDRTIDVAVAADVRIAPQLDRDLRILRTDLDERADRAVGAEPVPDLDDMGVADRAVADRPPNRGADRQVVGRDADVPLFRLERRVLDDAVAPDVAAAGGDAVQSAQLEPAAGTGSTRRSSPRDRSCRWRTAGRRPNRS